MVLLLSRLRTSTTARRRPLPLPLRRALTDPKPSPNLPPPPTRTHLDPLPSIQRRSDIDVEGEVGHRGFERRVHEGSAATGVKVDDVADAEGGGRVGGGSGRG